MIESPPHHFHSPPSHPLPLSSTSAPLQPQSFPTGLCSSSGPLPSPRVTFQLLSTPPQVPKVSF